MLTLKPGEHGSTYGGNPLACKVATAALEVLREEELCENSTLRGQQLRDGLNAMVDHTIIDQVRGRGLLCAIVINQPKAGYGDKGKAWDLCLKVSFFVLSLLSVFPRLKRIFVFVSALKMKEHGLLAKPTHGNIIRFAPPLIITEEEINQCLDIIQTSVGELA